MDKEKLSNIARGNISEEMIFNLFNGLQNFMLRNKPHIKEYKKVRKIHDEITDSMVKYVENGKFKINIKSDDKLDKKIKSIFENFDYSEEFDMRVMYDILMYKNSTKIYCITEEYINKNKFRREDKIELLNSMLNSVSGLFKVIKVDREMGQVYLKDLLTNKEYCITDIAMTSNPNDNKKTYMYARIITYKGVSFGTGLSIVFRKDDPFILKWIKDNKKVYAKREDIYRLLELYERYKKDDNNIKVTIRNI